MPVDGGTLPGVRLHHPLSGRQEGNHRDQYGTLAFALCRDSGRGLCLEEFVQELQEAIENYVARGGDPAKVEAFIQTSTD